jgi:CheY-like chemotaxis protein
MADTPPLRILLIDDEPDSLRLAHDILEMTGAEVHCAANGEEFSALWSTTHPDLVVVDLAMPKPDGWDVLARVRAGQQGVSPQVIAITSYYSESVLSRARRAGFDALVSKPLRYAELIGVVERVMSRA